MLGGNLVDVSAGVGPNRIRGPGITGTNGSVLVHAERRKRGVTSTRCLDGHVLQKTPDPVVEALGCREARRLLNLGGQFLMC